MWYEGEVSVRVKVRVDAGSTDEALDLLRVVERSMAGVDELDFDEPGIERVYDVDTDTDVERVVLGPGTVVRFKEGEYKVPLIPSMVASEGEVVDGIWTGAERGIVRWALPDDGGEEKPRTYAVSCVLPGANAAERRACLALVSEQRLIVEEG